MSTRSLIGIANKNDTIDYVYCHFDGYINGGVGESLIKNFPNEKSVRQLISRGDMSALGHDGVPTYYNSCSRDELIHTVLNDDYTVAGSDYIYLFHPGAKTWVYKDILAPDWKLLVA